MVSGTKGRACHEWSVANIAGDQVADEVSAPFATRVPGWAFHFVRESMPRGKDKRLD